MNEISATQTEGLFNIELEQQVLGAVLSNNELYHKISGLVRPEDFRDPVHADIWRNIATRIERDHLASAVTVKTDMESHDGLKELGGSAYLARLVGASVCSFAVADYATELRALADRRALVDRCQDVIARVQSGEDAGAGLAQLELITAEMGEASAEPRTMSLLRAQTIAIQEIIERQQQEHPGIPTGLADLDKLLTLREQRYTILAGATSMGKSALGIWLSFAAAQAGYGVGFVTLEMSESDLSARINSIASQVPYKAFDRKMSESVLRNVVEAAKAQEALPIEIFSERVRDIPSILSEGKRLKRKMQPNGPFKGFKLLVVDYIQLVRGRGSTEFHALSRVANDLKQVAKQLGVHVIALAQIDRKIGDREDPRPRLSDLRGSGDLENAPDNVIFAFRPEYYLARELLSVKDIEKQADIEADLSRCKDKMEVIIAKARMGELGSVMVGCDMATNRFYDLVGQGEIAF